MTATGQSSEEQPTVTGPSTALAMDVDNSHGKMDVEKSQAVSDGVRTNGTDVIDLPPDDDDFGDDEPVFDDNDALNGRTDSLLTAIKSEMSKQGIEISGGDTQIVQTTPQEPSDSVDTTPNGAGEQQGPSGSKEENVEEQKAPLEESHSLQELVAMIKEEARKKIDDPEDKFAKRFEQLTKIIDEIQDVEKGRESTAVKIHLAVKIEEMQLASGKDKAIRCWRQLIEDLDLDLRGRKSRAQKKIADKEKIQELKRLGLPIPKELTKKGHAKLLTEIAQAQKEIKKLHKQRSKLQLRELSLDDLDKEDNAFLKETRIARRINFLVKKVAKLQGCTLNARRPMYQPIKYKESEFDDINEAISKEVTKLIKEKPLDSKSRMKGVAPDFVDIDDIVKNTNSGKSMEESVRKLESQKIFKYIIDELRTRRDEELEESMGQYESDEELSETRRDPEAKDDELEKKLIPLDEARKNLAKVVNDYVSKAEMISAEDLAKDEAEAIKDEEEDEKAAIEKDTNEDLDDEEDEDGDDDDEEELGAEGENGEPQSQESASELDTIKSKEESDDDDDSDDEAVGSGGENELVDLASGDEEDSIVPDPLAGPSTIEDLLGDFPSEDKDTKPNFDNDGEDDTIEPPMKKLKKTTDDVEEITLSSDDDE